MLKIINIQQYPEWLERTVDYFSSRRNIHRQLYVDSMEDSQSIETSVPRWYLMLRGDKIIGGCGLILQKTLKIMRKEYRTQSLSD